MLILDPLLYHTFYDDSGEKQVVKHSRFLKTVIPNFKDILSTLLIKILEEEHNYIIVFDQYNKLTYTQEKNIKQYLEHYLTYLIGEDIKFSLNFKYKKNENNIHKYEIILV